MLVLGLAAAICVAFGESAQGPERKSHCTLAGDDFPLVLALTEIDALDEQLPVAPGVELSGYKAAWFLLDRHRHGHGGWPEATSSQGLADLGLAPCDSAALDALLSAARTNVGREFRSLDALQVARWLERNGRWHESEQLLLAAIPQGSAPARDVEWREYGRFLARRGRHAEALPLIEGFKGRPGGCSLGSAIEADSKFEWVELCHDKLFGAACEDTLFEKRLEILGIDGLAEYVAGRKLARGSALPVREAKAWFELHMLAGRVPGQRAASWRTEFDSDLSEWTRSVARAPEHQSFDWSRPEEVERGVARARELARKDASAAITLLERAAETGLPVAGKAVLELAADRTIEWTEFDRGHVLDLWRDAILTRTFGCADPDDPATW